MAKLEDITAGSHVLGIAGNEPVSIVAVQWYGTNVIEITYKNSMGVPGTQLIYREDEENIHVNDNHLPWSFDTDGNQMRLASEAYRISLAHLFDPYLAVHTSSVEPLPHQISAVYQEMLPRLPLRFVLADDPGAGKTIMTELFIKELIARGSLKRCLIVSPGSLVEQWQDELFQKFHLHFEILTNDRIESLRELLMEAVRYGNDPDVRERLNRIVDSTINQGEFERMINESALTDDVMDLSKVMAIREDMERIEAHKLQPHFIEAFFVEAFTSAGGKIRKREKGRYEITSVPYAVRNRDTQIGYGEPVLSRYERVCFDKEYCNVQGLSSASLIGLGHPLLDATLDLVRERSVDVMKRGSVFIDERDFGTKARLLFYIEDAVQDGIILKDGGRRTISKNVHFVELDEHGNAMGAGYAPYLDYRATNEEEQAAVLS